MSDGPGEWVEKDAFVLPVIPEELGIEPQFIALLHVAAFLELSGDGAVDPDWAVEAMEHVSYYLHRLPATEVERLSGQLERLASFGESQGWPEEVVEFIRSFFEVCGLVDGEDDQE